MSNRLNIASIQKTSYALGPGKRFVFWVQGCPFNCHNCISPNWIPFEVAQAWEVEALAETILNTPEIDGITISGGEPMMQANRIADVLSLVLEEKPELNVIIFTGFTQQQLNWEDAQRLMEYTDVLITGLYVEKLNDNQGLRGSSNQEILFLSDKLIEEKEYFFHKNRDLEFYIQNDGVLMVGIPEQNFKW